MDQYIEKLEELVKDEDNVVTVPILATTLDLPINEVQNVLKKYVEIHEHSTQIHTTYVLCGTLISDKSIGVCLVKHTKLDESKQLFETEPNCTVYSVQKSPTIDYNVIALADSVCEDKFEKKALLGTIISKNCVKRVLKLKKLPPVAAPALKGKSTLFGKQTNSSTKSSSSESVKHDKPDEHKVKPQNGSIASMFSKAASSNKKQEDPKRDKTKSTGKISAFFTNSTKNSVSTKSVESVKTDELLEELMDVDFDDNIDSLNVKKLVNNENEKSKNHIIETRESNDKRDKDGFKKESEQKSESQSVETQGSIKSVESNKNKSGVNSKSDKTKKKRRRSRSEDKNTKRRKRIIVPQDSDSDDIFESHESDDVIENSEEEEPENVPAVTIKKPLAPKNKKRVAVDKTYRDEEGFIVTQVEYVYVSASEEEDVPEVKIEDKPKQQKPDKQPTKLEKKTSSTSENDDTTPTKGNQKNKKGKSKGVAGNQPTLMNFFTRK